MDNGNLKANAPKTCAAFDKWMDDAGFPEWKIGAEQFERFFEDQPEGTDATPGLLAKAVEEVVGKFTDDFRRAVADGKWTPAAEARKRRLFRTSNALLRNLWQQDRIGIWH